MNASTRFGDVQVDVVRCPEVATKHLSQLASACGSFGLRGRSVGESFGVKVELRSPGAQNVADEDPECLSHGPASLAQPVEAP